MKRVWIIGGGRFGLRAAGWLLRQADMSVDVTLVDLDRQCLKKARSLGCATEAGDGVDFLFRKMTQNSRPDWVVPAVPVHLAWEWCRLILGKNRLLSWPLPDEIATHLPNPMQGNDNQMYVSHADFLCPPNCNEPDDRCTMTGEPRKKDMFRLIAELNVQDIPSFVMQSRQLGPGVGGYAPADLFDLAGQIGRHYGRCLVATACRCHGVISGGFIQKQEMGDCYAA